MNTDNTNILRLPITIENLELSVKDKMNALKPNKKLQRSLFCHVLRYPIVSIVTLPYLYGQKLGQIICTFSFQGITTLLTRNAGFWAMKIIGFLPSLSAASQQFKQA